MVDVGCNVVVDCVAIRLSSGLLNVLSVVQPKARAKTLLEIVGGGRPCR